MVKSQNNARRKTSKSAQSALSICPTDGDGWCSFPFSPAQLQKRLKAKQLEKQLAEKTKTTKKKSK